MVRADTESVMVNRLAKIVDDWHTRRASLQTCSVLSSSRTWSTAEAPTADGSDASGTCILANKLSCPSIATEYDLWVSDAERFRVPVPARCCTRTSAIRFDRASYAAASSVTLTACLRRRWAHAAGVAF
jgi:hypothetical protein